MVAPSNSVLIDFGLVFSFAATGLFLLRVIGFVLFSLHFSLFVCLSVCLCGFLVAFFGYWPVSQSLNWAFGSCLFVLIYL